MAKEEMAAQRARQEVEIAGSLARIKRKLLVMSGKGGVGKSMISVSIAVGLADLGLKVGLMDVDLHGPSIPIMLGLRGSPHVYEDGKIVPVQFSENMAVISIEYLLENNEKPVIWRGPMKIGAIRQFISDVRWGDLDYLVIDSPPGTGDEPLTVAQTVSGAEAVIVTTPQAVSLRDVRKSINFCREVKMPVLGLIENMSGFTCPDCGSRIDLFKVGGGESVARTMDIPFLGSIPIIPDVVEACDNGTPAVNASETLREALEPVLASLSSTYQDIEPERHLPETTGTPTGRERMKIAIPVAQGKLAMHFGHCEEFALIDVNEEEKKIIGEETVPAPDHEPGLLPLWLNGQGANVIIAGGMGSRARALFAENDIKVVVGASSEMPTKIVEDYLEGRLVAGANVCDH